MDHHFTKKAQKKAPKRQPAIPEASMTLKLNEGTRKQMTATVGTVRSILTEKMDINLLNIGIILSVVFSNEVENGSHCGEIYHFFILGALSFFL
jgi:hypothetical protein